MKLIYELKNKLYPRNIIFALEENFNNSGDNEIEIQSSSNFGINEISEENRKNSFKIFYHLKFCLTDENYNILKCYDLITSSKKIVSFKIHRLNSNGDNNIFYFVLILNLNEIHPMNKEKLLKILYFEIDFDAILNFQINKSNDLIFNKEYLDLLQLLFDEKFSKLKSLETTNLSNLMSNFTSQFFFACKNFEINIRINPVNNFNKIQELEEFRNNLRTFYMILNEENSLIFIKIKKKVKNNEKNENTSNLTVNKQNLSSIFGFIEVINYKYFNYNIFKLLPFENYSDFTGENFVCLAQVGFNKLNHQVETTFITKLLIPNLEKELITYSDIVYDNRLKNEIPLYINKERSTKIKCSFISFCNKFFYKFLHQVKTEIYLILNSNRLLILDKNNLMIKNNINLNQLIFIEDKNIKYFPSNFDLLVLLKSQCVFCVNSKNEVLLFLFLMTNNSFLLFLIININLSKLEFIYYFDLNLIINKKFHKEHVNNSNFFIFGDFKYIKTSISEKEIFNIDFVFSDINQKNLILKIATKEYFLSNFNNDLKVDVYLLDFIKDIKTLGKGNGIKNLTAISKKIYFNLLGFSKTSMFDSIILKNTVYSIYDPQCYYKDFISKEKLKYNDLLFSDLNGVYYSKRVRKCKYKNYSKLDSDGIYKEVNNNFNSDVKLFKILEVDIKRNFEKENIESVKVIKILDIYPELALVIFYGLVVLKNTNPKYDDKIQLIIYNWKKQFILNTSFANPLSGKLYVIKNCSLKSRNDDLKIHYSFKTVKQFKIYFIKNQINGILLFLNKAKIIFITENKSQNLTFELKIDKIKNYGIDPLHLNNNNIFYDEKGEKIYLYNEKNVIFYYIDLKQEINNIRERIEKTLNQNEIYFIHDIEDYQKLEFNKQNVDSILLNDKYPSQNFESPSKLSIYNYSQMFIKQDLLLTKISHKLYFSLIDFNRNKIFLYHKCTPRSSSSIDFCNINITKILKYENPHDSLIHVILFDYYLVILFRKTYTQDIILYVYKYEIKRRENDNDFCKMKVDIVKILKFPNPSYNYNFSNIFTDGSFKNLKVEDKHFFLHNIYTDCVINNFNFDSVSPSYLTDFPINEYGNFLFSITYLSNKIDDIDLDELMNVNIINVSIGLENTKIKNKLIRLIVFEKDSKYYEFSLDKYFKNNLFNYSNSIAHKLQNFLIFFKRNQSSCKVNDMESFIKSNLICLINMDEVLKQFIALKLKNKRTKQELANKAENDEFSIIPKYRIKNNYVHKVKVFPNKLIGIVSSYDQNDKNFFLSFSENLKKEKFKIFYENLSIYFTMYDKFKPLIDLDLDILCKFVDFDIFKVQNQDKDYLFLFMLISHPEDIFFSNLEALHLSSFEKIKMNYSVLTLKILGNISKEEISIEKNIETDKDNIKFKITHSNIFNRNNNTLNELKLGNYVANIQSLKLNNIESEISDCKINDNCCINKEEDNYIFNKINISELTEDKFLLLVFSEYGFINFFIFNHKLQYENKLRFNFNSHNCNISKIKKDYVNRKDLHTLFILNEKVDILEKFRYYCSSFFDISLLGKLGSFFSNNRNHLLNTKFLFLFFNFGILIFEIINPDRISCSHETIKINFYQQITYDVIFPYKYSVIIASKNNQECVLNKSTCNEKLLKSINEDKLNYLDFINNEKYVILDNPYIYRDNNVSLEEGYKNLLKMNNEIISHDKEFIVFFLFPDNKNNSSSYTIYDNLKINNSFLNQKQFDGKDFKREKMKVFYNIKNKKFYVQ